MEPLFMYQTDKHDLDVGVDLEQTELHYHVSDCTFHIAAHKGDEP